MADVQPELEAQLRDLDNELEEGDITKKGYEKRRTVLLSQFFNASQVESRGLRVHSPDDTAHPSNNASRAASLAALNAAQAPRPPTPQDLLQNEAAQPGVLRQDSTISQIETLSDFSGEQAEAARISNTEVGQDPGGRMYGRELAVKNPTPQQFSHDRNLWSPPSRGENGPHFAQASPRDQHYGPEYAFNPASQDQYADSHTAGLAIPSDEQSRKSTMLDQQQGYFSDFAGQQSHDDKQRDSYGGGPHRYSSSSAFSPTAAQAPPMLRTSDLPPSAAYQAPLEPREIPFAVYDPHNPNVPMSKFDNVASVLRHRGKVHPKQPAYWVLDPRGKEVASITWEKLASRAEKVAQVIRDKSNLYRGDRVALIYRDSEIVEFAVALLGCFIAGVVAVPINNSDDYQKLNIILTSTQAHLALTTDNNLKAFQREITTQKLSWPRGVEWWKTNEFGSYHPKKKDEVPPLVVPDLAYIEFSRAPTGDLRGVVMSHRTIMHQMGCLSAIISTVPTSASAGDTFNAGLRDKNGRLLVGAGAGEILLSYLDPRQSIGMILGVLLMVYGGHTTIWTEARALETPGLYAHLITRYKATLMLADYPGLKRAAYNYQSDPMTTRNFKKNFEPNFSSVKLCLIDTLTVDSDFHEILADRWLRPMRNPRAREIVAPMLCLPEHGGMVISMRDWLGGEERMGCPLKLENNGDSDSEEEKKGKKASTGQNGYSSLIGSQTAQPADEKGRQGLGEVLLDKEALKTNEIVIVATGEEARKRAGNEPGVVRVGAFGYPIPDATLAVVDPESSLLCTPYAIGEIWVDSPSLSGGFWALPRHTQTIFHARPYRFDDVNPTPIMADPEFLRTGLLGCVIEGQVYVLGLYEDRLRQKVQWVDDVMDNVEYRYFFVQHLIVTIMKNVPKIYDCSAFDIFVNGEHLPVILLESAEASTNPQTSGALPRQLDIPLLDGLSERCMDILFEEHHLRVYCVLITAPNTLPRVIKNGRKEIGNMLCRREFDNGSLPCVHVKFGVERAVLNLPVGTDPVGGIWSPISTQARQDLLIMQDKQYSGVDYREVVIDDRTSTPLNSFLSMIDLLQWRVARQTDELSYCTIDGRGKEGKGLTWKKLDTKIAAVATYLRNKGKVRPGDRLILMYTHSEEFVFAVHACFCLGAVAIPMAPLDQNRLHEDAPAFLHMVADFQVKAVLVNNDVDHLLKQKAVSQHIKQSAMALKTSMPNTYNTSKPPKQTTGCRDLGLTAKPEWVKPGNPVLVWTYWTPDQRRIAVQLGHDTIMGMCKVLKETCQMTSSRPILGCVRSSMGLGFIHTCLMGVFVGAPTYLVSPVDFAQNPSSLFHTISRYKIKDTYATGQMLDHAMSTMPGKGFTLHELKNLMISNDGRPRTDIFPNVRSHFANTGLEPTNINTIYTHVLNPMIASRSYMCVVPTELWLDRASLRGGLVVPVDPDQDSSALLIQDSGMVPVSTQIAIVNPETCCLCHLGEYGEIWVQSEACVKSFYGSKDAFDAERFNGRTFDGDPHVTYVRTGDLGFLHNINKPIGANNVEVEMQVLFVLGAIGETFEVNGLSHFPMDIERSVETCHRHIVPGGCAVFQAGGLVVVLVEVTRKSFLASIVPVIVNAILNEHQLVTDIVAFVSKGDFPRSRLGEKQRGKILASWVTRKMQTIAQFGIRDTDGADSQITEVAEPLSGMDSAYNSSHIASSLRNVESSPAIAEDRQPERVQDDYVPLPTGISEMPDNYAIPSVEADVRSPIQTAQSEITPTDPHSTHFELPDHGLRDPDPPSQLSVVERPSSYFPQNDHPDFDAIASFAPWDPDRATPSHMDVSPQEQPSPLATPDRYIDNDLMSLPSQQGRRQRTPPSHGTLRAVNTSTADYADQDNNDDEGHQEWPLEAIRHMNNTSREPAGPKALSPSSSSSSLGRPTPLSKSDGR
ncbi:MAG: putative NRPS-like protein biosynthetic cluster [Sclerophora amabilis]|nr:MAG: putative NRPS-like protein biosynthetic cluster [Sclerophora amabilis]